MFKPGDTVRTVDGKEGIIAVVERINKKDRANVTHKFDILVVTNTYGYFHSNLWYNETQLELID